MLRSPRRAILLALGCWLGCWLGSACAGTSVGSPAGPGSTRIEGTARNAKAGAVVIDAADRPIYIDGLAAWPPSLLGRGVVVTGRLEVHEGSACVRDPMPCQAIGGSYQSLANATWQPR